MRVLRQRMPGQGHRNHSNPIPLVAALGVAMLTSSIAAPAAVARRANLAYALDSGATITYVVPTSGTPVVTLGTEQLRGNFVLTHSAESPFGGAEFFTVQHFVLSTSSGIGFRLDHVDPAQDPILAATSVPASFWVNFTDAGSTHPGLTLAGHGLALEPGYVGFVIQDSGLMVPGAFEGDSAAPSGLAFGGAQPFTPPGVGLYQYTAPECDPDDPSDCSWSLLLVAVLNFHASLRGGA